MSLTKSKFFPVSVLILLSMIWGTSFILIKQGLKVFGPDEVGALRVSAAAVFLLPYALVKIWEIDRKDFLKLFVAGIVGTFIPAFLFATAQTRLDSSIAGILNTLSPLFTMLMGAILFRQHFRGFAVVGMLVGLAGSVVLVIAGKESALAGLNIYALLIVIACVLYGTNLNFIKFKIHHINALTITSIAMMLIGPLAMVYLFGFSDFIFHMKTTPGAWRAFGFIVLLGIMSTAIATSLFTILVKITSPFFASSVTYLMPIVSVMWGMLDGEALVSMHFVGMALILGGVWVANRK
jgi:drug/metabolite transporter (DMT)-like permease